VARAFEPFFTTKATGKGSGLGLSQVFGFIKQSNGHVKIYSELGSGTAVKLYLPRLMTDLPGEVKTEPAPPEVPRAKDNETILLVENDADVIAYAKEALESLGYMVVATQDAASALQALEDHPQIALAFSDLALLGMNGPAMVGLALRRRPDLAVLYTTAYPANAIVHGSRIDPGFRIINKPFVLADLARAVRDALDRSTAETRS
jgi:CheY-like chemotaxis protein